MRPPLFPYLIRPHAHSPHETSSLSVPHQTSRPLTSWDLLSFRTSSDLTPTHLMRPPLFPYLIRPHAHSPHETASLSVPHQTSRPLTSWDRLSFRTSSDLPCRTAWWRHVRNALIVAYRAHRLLIRPLIHRWVRLTFPPPLNVSLWNTQTKRIYVMAINDTKPNVVMLCLSFWRWTSWMTRNIICGGQHFHYATWKWNNGLFPQDI